MDCFLEELALLLAARESLEEPGGAPAEHETRTANADVRKSDQQLSFIQSLLELFRC